MQPKSPACDPPCCRGRLAKQWPKPVMLFLVFALLWPATASSQPSTTKSAVPLPAPSLRLQQRKIRQRRTLTKRPELQPALQLVASFGKGFEGIKQAVQEHRLAFLQDDSAIASDSEGEEIAPGESESDSCFVSAPLSSLSVDISASGEKMPQDIAAVCRAVRDPVFDNRLMGGWAQFEKHWAATCMHHRPLYFEEVNAERYGYTVGHRVQPFISAGRFLVTIPALPYLMIAHPRNECNFTLGHYRPGDCVPRRCHFSRWRPSAAVFEGAVVVGLIALIP